MPDQLHIDLGSVDTVVCDLHYLGDIMDTPTRKKSVRIGRAAWQQHLIPGLTAVSVRRPIVDYTAYRCGCLAIGSAS